MSKIILVTGGARSGKSTFAEKLANDCGDTILYIATSVPFDDEMKERVKKHQAQRPSHWQTLEAYKSFDEILPQNLHDKSGAMLDCITVMVTNIMFDNCSDFDNITIELANSMEEAAKLEVCKLLECIKVWDKPFIFVTNEVGMGIVPDNVASRIYRDIAGRINQMIAQNADEVYLCVSGIPVKIK